MNDHLQKSCNLLGVSNAKHGAKVEITRKMSGLWFLWFSVDCGAWGVGLQRLWSCSVQAQNSRGDKSTAATRCTWGANKSSSAVGISFQRWCGEVFKPLGNRTVIALYPSSPCAVSIQHSCSMVYSLSFATGAWLKSDWQYHGHNSSHSYENIQWRGSTSIVPSPPCH